MAHFLWLVAAARVAACASVRVCVCVRWHFLGLAHTASKKLTLSSPHAVSAPLKGYQMPLDFATIPMRLEAAKGGAACATVLVLVVVVAVF